MESQLSFTQLGCSYGTTQAEGNDIWGWTHGLNTQTERDFALVGCTTGTSFVEITDPVNPKVMGFLPTPSSASTWRDIKVYKDFAFIVTEARNSGMQVFNLTHLLNVANPGPSNQFKADACTPIKWALLPSAPLTTLPSMSTLAAPTWSAARPARAVC
jgi:choice-of-anchor B domain-containing protein